MRRGARAVAVVLGAAALLAALAFLGNCTAAGRSVVDTVTGDTPEARIAAYLDQVGRSDTAAALAVWQLYERGPAPSGLRERREAVTEQLAAAKPRSYTIDAIQWWATCCEPGVIDDRAAAGGARASVTLHLDDGRSVPYVFDVFARDTDPIWNGLPAREWVLREVYPASLRPLLFTWPANHR